MEQKKTLWITLAAGIFLLVVLGAAILLYAPQAKKSAPSSTWITPALPLSSSDSTYTQGTASVTSPETYTEVQEQLPSETEAAPEEIAVEVVSESQPQASEEQLPGEPLPSSITAENVTVYAQGTASIYGTTIDLNNTSSAVTAKNETAKAAIDAADAKKAEETQIAAKAKASETAATDTSAEKKTASSSSKTSTAAKSSSGSSKSSAAKSSSGSSTTSKASASKKSSSTASAGTAVQDTYWVQVASYTTKKNADEARAILEAAKLPCEVFTFTDKDGKLYFRVRVGPYTTLSEAKYWQSKITSIKEFEKAGTYITNSSAAAK